MVRTPGLVEGSGFFFNDTATTEIYTLSLHDALPISTMLGALYRYLRDADPAHFQPMNANFGLLEPLDPPVKDRAQKRERLAARALAEFDEFVGRVNAEVGTQ